MTHGRKFDIERRHLTIKVIRAKYFTGAICAQLGRILQIGAPTGHSLVCT